MRPFALHDRAVIEAGLRRETERRIYEIGDLDPFFWPYTCWFAEGRIEAPERLALLYFAADPPVLLALGGEAPASLAGFVGRLAPLLPRRCYAHLSAGVLERLAAPLSAEARGLHLKMALREPERLDGRSDEGIERLSAEDGPAILELYERAYPGNWFEPRMLETGKYFGLRERGALLAIAGVHVYSEAEGVAALGNIAVDPERRGRGLAGRVTAALCRDLRATAPVIGLNVRADNAAAIRCYRGLGFEAIAEYDEAMLTSGL